MKITLVINRLTIWRLNLNLDLEDNQIMERIIMILGRVDIEEGG